MWHQIGHTKKSLVKVVTGALNIFTEVQKDKLEIQTIEQMAADITAKFIS